MSTLAANDTPGSRAARDGTLLALPAISPAVLRRLDDLLCAATTADDRRMGEIASHLIVAGGKRLRPMLVLACAAAVGGADSMSPRVLDAATAIELFHLASLYHDDVLDEAALRRGRPSANALWGNVRAVLGGDMLLAHAYRVAARLGPKELSRLSAASLEVCRGQIAECDQRFDGARSIADYERSICGKTAALLATACWLGAATAGDDDHTAETLARFGTEIGVAFQIVDDILDLNGASSVVGKPTGNDLREGVFTLPVLLAIGDDPSIADLLTPGIDDHSIAEVRQRVKAHGADRRAAENAAAHLRAATDCLTAIDLQPEGRRALGEVADAVLNQMALLTPPDTPAHTADGI